MAKKKAVTRKVTKKVPVKKTRPAPRKKKAARKKTGGKTEPTTLQKISAPALHLQEKVHEKLHEHTGLRRLSKYAIFTISILTAALLSETIETFVLSFVDHATYTAVLLRMLVVILVYVPLFGFLDKYINKAANKYISISKNSVRSSRQGLALGFAVALFIQFLLFAYLVHKLNFFGDLFGLLGSG